MIQFQENGWADGRTDQRKEGQPLFYRTLLETAGVPKLGIEK